MRKVRILLACCFLLYSCLGASAQQTETPKSQSQSDTAALERELREFYDSYAEDLRAHRREAIADRYDRRGVFLLGNGSKRFESFEAKKTSYLTRWNGPKSFAWKDLSVEILSPDAAVVMGLFEWQTDKGQSFSYSYTGVLIKQSGKWRIRVEDESMQPPKPPSP